VGGGFCIGAIVSTTHGCSRSARNTIVEKSATIMKAGMRMLSTLLPNCRSSTPKMVPVAISTRKT
jgi:hypothetical protein